MEIKKDKTEAFPLNSLGVTHAFLASQVQEGAFCIDATAGNGHDTAFLCRLAGPTGRVLALDIQPQAVENTNRLLEKEGLAAVGHAEVGDHAELGRYAPEESVDAVCFNFGWLPGGDHAVFTRPATSLPALEAALRLLKPGGVLSLCLYYGGKSGYEERDAVLAWLKEVDNRRFTVLELRFANRTGDVPIPVFVLRRT